MSMAAAIDYSGTVKNIDDYGQYILMSAELTNRTYQPTDFITAIGHIQWPDTLDPQRRNSLGVERVIMTALAQRSSSVTISDFNPDIAKLEQIMRTHVRSRHSD